MVRTLKRSTFYTEKCDAAGLIPSCATFMRFVSFLDILGFADIVESMPIQTVLRSLEVTLSMVPLVRSLGSVPGVAEPQFHIKAKESNVTIFSFSDTFVLATRDDSPTSLFQIVAGTAIFSTYLFAAKLPVRGAITCGEAEYIHGTSHMVGRAIVRAARLEKCQEWFGVVIDPDILNAERLQILSIPLLKPLVVDYNVPLKPGAGIPNPCKVVNWRFNMVVQHGVSSLLREGADPIHKTKRRHTLEFCRWLRTQGLAEGQILSADGKDIGVPWLRGCWVADKPPGTVGVGHGDEY
jgi:hypothetical protein